MKYVKEKSVIISGVWLIVMPYMGVPRSWKSFLTVLTGIVLVYLGGLVLKEVREKNKTVVAPDNKPEKITINM